MTYIDDINIIYNIMSWFRKNMIDDLPNDDTIWKIAFTNWLMGQGCTIEYSQLVVLRNGLGFAPNYDQLRFDRDEDATLFMLRWTQVELNHVINIGLGRYVPEELTVWGKLWWRFVPGEVINVRWPKGDITITEDHPLWDWTIGPSMYIVESADPNDHYRPELEKFCGRQGWNWNWGMVNNDMAENRLTIKIRKKYSRWATYFALIWQ